jgi:hypothetical protein
LGVGVLSFWCKVRDSRFGVWGFRVWGLEFGGGVWSLGFRVWGLGFGVCGLGFGVSELGVGVSGLGFRVWDLGSGYEGYV